MKTFKLLWKPFSLLIIIVSFLSYLAISCADSDECDSYTSLMTPHIVDVKNLDPYYYIPYYQFYYCDEEDNERIHSSPDYKNSLEWKQYTKSSIQEADIHQVLYQTSYEELKVLYQHIEKGQALHLKEINRENGFVKWFLQSKDLEALGYLMFAKQCEAFSVKPQDDWNQAPLPLKEMNQKIKNGLMLYRAAKEPEFKRRYAFQLIKTSFYAKNYQQAISFFDSLAKPFLTETSSLNDRMISYKAGAFYRLGKKEESAYLFMQLFDRCDDYDVKFNQYISYDWASKEKEMAKILKLCKNNHEKSVVYALQGFKHPEVYHLSSLQKVVELDPNNEMIDVLLSREVNKIEREFAQFKYRVEQGFNYYNYFYDNIDEVISKKEMSDWLSRKDFAVQHLQTFANYLTQTADETKVRNKGLWYVSAAYLYLLSEQYGSAESLMMKADYSRPNLKVKNQLEIFRLLNEVQQGMMDTALEAKLLPKLVWFESLANQNIIYRKAYRDLIGSVLPIKYKQSNDTLKMMLCYEKYEYLSNARFMPEAEMTTPKSFSEKAWTTSGEMMDRRFSIAQLDALKRFNSNNRTPFEKWLSKKNVYSDDLINELKAVKWMRESKFQEASLALSNSSSMPDVPNPFVAHLRDYQDAYHEDTLLKFSFKALADTLAILQQNKDLKSKYLLACALYSMSYHGKCGYAISYYRSYADLRPYFFLADKPSSAYYLQYFYTDNAFQLFKKVYDESKDQKMKSSSLWMLAKIYQHRYPKEIEMTYVEDHKASAYSNWASYENIYLKKFQEEFKGLSYYDSCYNECSYLRNYASKH